MAASEQGPRQIDLDRCVHCERCAESCPRDALYLDTEFAMAAFSRDALKFVTKQQ